MRGLLLHRPSSELQDEFGDRLVTSGPLGRAPSGQRYVERGSSPSSNYGTATGLLAAPIAAGSVVLADTGFANGSIQATNSVTANGNRLYCRVARAAGTVLDGIFLNCGAGSYTLQRLVANAATVIGTFATAPANGDVLKLQFWGPNLVVFVNGTSRIVASDGWCLGQTRHGLVCITTAARWDNLTIARF